MCFSPVLCMLAYLGLKEFLLFLVFTTALHNISNSAKQTVVLIQYDYL